LRGDRTHSTVASNFDDNAAMIGIAPLNSGGLLVTVHIACKNIYRARGVNNEFRSM
jgi:hypothetical protein